MRLAFLALLAVSTAAAQSVAVTSPTAAQSVTGFLFPLSVSITSIPNLARVVYTVDTVFAGQSVAAPWSVNWNPYNQLNGPHTITATAYDSLGNVITAGPSVSFTTANTSPIYNNTTPAFTVTPSTAFSSAWTGTVNLNFSSLTGLTAQVFVDGIAVPQIGNANPAVIDTTKFDNGPHTIGWRLSSSAALYTACQLSLFDYGEGAQAVTFSNGVTAMEVRTNVAEFWIAAAGTFTLSGQIYNTDESTSAATMQYYSLNTSIATVGQTSGVVGGVGPGSNTFFTYPGGQAPIRATAINFSGADLTVSGIAPNAFASSASYTFTSLSSYTPGSNNAVGGQVIWVTGGAGCAAGPYEISHVNNSHLVTLSTIVNNVSSSGVAPGAPGVVCSWSTGPTVTVFANVRPNPNAAIPHFNSAGQFNTTGPRSNSLFVSDTFNTNPQQSGFYDVNYPNFGNDYANISGYTSYEFDMWPSSTWNGYGSQSTWTAAISATVAAAVAAVSPYPKLRIMGLNQPQIESIPNGLYPTIYGPGASFTPPLTTDAFQRWAATGLMLGDNLSDESPYSYPTIYPVNLGSFGFSQLVCTGTTCTGTWPGWVLGGEGTPYFSITGSSVTGMNNVSPTIYKYTSIDSSHFSFPSTAAAGTYTSSNDPGLTLQRFAWCWINPSTGATTGSGGSCATTGSGPYTDIIHQDAFVTFATQARAGTGTVKLSNAVVGDGLDASNIIGFQQPAADDYATLYWSGGGYNYLTVKNSINSNITMVGNRMREAWQAIPDTSPWVMEIYGTPANYGFHGYTSVNGNGATLTISSCATTSNVFTCIFTSPHGILNIIPGANKITISGSTGGVLDGSYWILTAPTATTVTLAMIAPNFSSSPTSYSGATLTFQDGTVYSLTLLANGSGIAAGVVSTGRSQMSVSNICSAPFIGGKIGQWFTIAGVTPSTSPVNFSTSGNVFVFGNESNPFCTGSNGSGLLWFHQIPQLTGTGGSVSIQSDNLLVRGRNYAWDVDIDQDMMTVQALYAMGLGAAGFSQYELDSNPQGASSAPGGASNALVGTYYNQVNDACPNTKQLGMVGNAEVNPLSPNSSTRASLFSVGNATKMATRILPYLYGSRLASPNYGRAFECFARDSRSLGGKGQMLMCINMTNASETRTFALSTYETVGQNVVRFLVNAQGIQLSTIAAATNSQSVTVAAATAVIYLFPTTFAGELSQPAISARLADVTNATKIVVRYSYDPYDLDIANLSVDCSTGAVCVLPVDLGIGHGPHIWYRIIYLNSGGVALSTSDIQTI